MKKSTVWDETYSCVLYYYLMTIVSLTMNISIYGAIGAPGHGKYISDGLNARDKIYHRK